MTQDDRLLRQLEEWIEQVGSGPSFGAVVENSLESVWGASEFVSTACLRNPSLLRELVDRGVLERTLSSGELSAWLAARLKDVADDTRLAAVLRQFRNQQMVRIIWRDICRWASLDETLEDLSELADVCIQQALDIHYDWLTQAIGIPRNEAGEPQQLVVLGMGKLGARELNLSSDIDLIFAFPEAGETDGRRALSNEQFFTRLGQKINKSLNSQTADGFVFRVDMRLRPFGDAGPLAASFDFMETYYQSQAREWERYAMIKARVVAGDRDAGRDLMSMLRPFVYRRYIDFGAVESLRGMKRLISANLYEKGMAANIKLGPGGIREIEFIGQAFQLVRGGRDPDLQIRPIQQVLARLADKGLVPEADVAELVAAYRFLRDAENRLQAWRDEQTQLLPADETGRRRLALTMGFDDWAGFSAVLEEHRDRVQRHFEQLFAGPDEEGESASPLTDVWQQRPEAAGLDTLLAAGFDDPEKALALMTQFRESRGVNALGTRGRTRMDLLMPRVLAEAGQSDAPCAVFEQLTRILEAVAQRTAYLDLLVENPQVLTQLTRLVSASPWFAEQILRQPVLLDELVDPRELYAPLDRDSLRHQLDQLIAGAEGDLEQEMERLRQFASTNRLRVAAADVTGAIPLMVVSDYLTDIAQVALEAALRMAWRDVTAKHGGPRGIEGADTGLAIVGYGKLGGIELGYGSDLDLVFLHGNRDANGTTDGKRPLGNDVFYARLGQRIVFILTTRTASGIVYEVDMRLRPNGNAGMLVTSLDTFDHYQHNEAWTWEHQALIRARFVAGDAAVAERFAAIRKSVLLRPRDEATLRTEVREMREKMRASLDKSTSSEFDLKQGQGGIMDIEFMVQFAVLRSAHEHPRLVDWTDNIRLLETLAALDLMEGGAADKLADMYRVFRAGYHRNALRERPGLVAADVLVEERRIVSEMWQEMMSDP